MTNTKLLIKAALATAIAAVALQSAQADAVYGIYADANYWNGSYSNSDDYKSDTKSFSVSSSFEHGIPMVPNLRVESTKFDVEFTDESEKEQQDHKVTDLIAYYEVLDNVVSVDLGLGAKRYANEISSNEHGKSTHSETMPMLYGSVGAKLPMTGFSVKGSLDVAKKDEVHITDMQAEIQYDFVESMAFDAGAKLGYRVMTLEDKDYDFKAKTKGPYIGVGVHF